MRRALAIALLLAAHALPANAQDPAPASASPGPTPPASAATSDLAPRIFDPLDPARGPRDWRVGAPRWFVSGIFDTGYLYVRPRFSAGYGRPHYAWAGFEANPLVSGEGAGGYFGLRGALPRIDLRVGARYFHTFDRAFLCPTIGFDRADRCQTQPALEFYDREDIESRIGPQSIYLTFESELTVNLPLGPGKVVSELALSAVTGVPDGYFVFEETIKIAIEPPWVWRGRFGYAFPVDREKTTQIGVVGEVVHAVEREVVAIRGGITGRVRLYANLEARGIFVPLLHSKDEIGAAGADTFLLGIRYRWASD